MGIIWGGGWGLPTTEDVDLNIPHPHRHPGLGIRHRGGGLRRWGDTGEYGGGDVRLDCNDNIGLTCINLYMDYYHYFHLSYIESGISFRNLVNVWFFLFGNP